VRRARPALLVLGLALGGLEVACSTSAPADAGPDAPACTGGKQAECASAGGRCGGGGFGANPCGPNARPYDLGLNESCSPICYGEGVRDLCCVPFDGGAAVPDAGGDAGDAAASDAAEGG
jgi:hypothetical protein